MNGDLQVTEEPTKDNSRKDEPGGENSKGEGPEAGKGLAWWRSGSEISTSEIQWVRRRGVWDGARDRRGSAHAGTHTSGRKLEIHS